jgi:hypothetical protein
MMTGAEATEIKDMVILRGEAQASQTEAMEALQTGVLVRIYPTILLPLSMSNSSTRILKTTRMKNR